ncbi:hypothetical protein [Bradyrhizobium sp. 131]|uniref:hypothetical protein n=1 Tax=Bradyrhizobium sp. 131 TaxID=2782609 RepID=UPI002051F850|nr:hypothetical protein IVA73_06435 [Bradyrhizobium sp. 131]
MAQLQQANLSQLGELSGPRLLRTVGNNEFDLASYLEDSFWMLAILAECVFQRLRAARKQATKDTILFADDPVSKPILANKDGRPSGASGRILDELHDRNPRTISENRLLHSTSGQIALRVLVLRDHRGFRLKTEFAPLFRELSRL